MRDLKPQYIKRGTTRFDQLFVVRSIFVVVGLVFIARLFYLQVLNQSYYKQAARDEQFKRLEIEPERGSLYMRSSGDVVALAVNESRYTIVADPTYVTDPQKSAEQLSPLLAVPKDDIEKQLKKQLRYVVLAKKVTKETMTKIAELRIKGVAWQEDRQRAYPQGTIASTVLGFVNDEGDGQYGVEGSLNDMLKGTPGLIRAVTDIQGVPLVQNKDNIVNEPVSGKDVVLTIDQTIQRIVEDELKSGVEKTKAKSGSVIVMESSTGRVAAMASYPSYDPAHYTKVEDASLFKNKVVSDPMEPGSIMKLLTMATALDVGVVNKDSTYFDKGFQDIDGSIVRNVVDLSAGTRNMFEVLRYSLNTGAIYLLQQMGGGDINEKARTTWYTYLSDHFLLTQDPAIEQQESTKGVVHLPNEGDGLRVQYANMSFGQGVSATLLQMASATCAVLNGGTYYKPTLVYGTKTEAGIDEQKPEVLKSGVVQASTTVSVVDLMLQYSTQLLGDIKREGFIVGGKTGTAQVPKLDGSGYREDVYNGTFTGFIGRNTPQYVVLVRLDEGPVEESFGGFYSARPVFQAIATGIMDNVPITE